MAGRPTTGMRMATATSSRAAGYGRIGTAARMGTGARGTTAANRAAMGGALNAQVRVPNRPMTQQGLGGISTARGPGRAVMDESYFLGLLRGKIGEVNMEINQMREAITQLDRDHGSYLSYEKRAEALAAELKELQGELGDLNMLNDKLNTSTDIDDVRAEREDIKTHNDREAADVDEIFTERSTVEGQIKKVNSDIEAEMNMAEAMVAEMSPHQKQAYQQLKDGNAQMAADIAEKQQTLDAMNAKLGVMEDEMRQNPIKQEAIALYDEIHSLESKRDAISAEINTESKQSEPEQRESLLAQVKVHNQEISAMERKLADIQNEMNAISNDLNDSSDDEDQENDEKRQKYLELLKREEEIDKFLDNFDDEREAELANIAKSQQNVVQLLESTSSHYERSSQLPSRSEHADMKDDLAFKEREMERSQATAETLEQKRARLGKDLAKVANLEEKISREMEILQGEMAHKKEELHTFQDLDGLARQTKDTKADLEAEKELLVIRKAAAKEKLKEVSDVYDKKKADLAANETSNQLVALEKKWQHLEKNNFVMKEFISAKESEADYRPIMAQVQVLVHDHNKALKSALKAKK